RNGGHDVYLQDLTTKKQTRITTSGKAIRPRIQGNRIVWMDGRNGGNLEGDIWPVGNWDIYMYDIATSKEYQITTNNSLQAEPDIYKDRIVWRDHRNMGENPYEHIQVYMYNISTSTESPVNYGENLVHFVNGAPRIHGNKIVWMAESIGTNYNIYVYDLPTSTLTMINYTSGYDFDPAIYGDRVVWADGVDPGNADIKMYNLSTSTGIQITTNKSWQESPAIYGDKIVWKDSRNWNENDMYNYDIYMATLSYLPAASFSASPVSGKAPLKVQFTDRSAGAPTSWKWSFGDKTYSTQKNPKHTYSKPGKYTVSLTVKNAVGSNTKTVSGYIVVKK
ncbi:MAG: PKD domain-containing protein, partial [Methanosarcina sp.]